MSDNKQSALEARVVRYGDLVPCTSAFIDTRTPGSERKENFTIIGPGVAENPDQYVHIEEPHGFNIGGARQPPGCVNSQHSHETAEVFVVHTGRWAFTLGENAGDGSIELNAGDAISIPTEVFRGFTNVGDEPGFLFAVLGGDDPGRVTWAPYVFDAAREHGLVLLESGRLIDTAKGETIPLGARPMPPTTARDVAKLRRMTAEDIAECVVRSAEMDELEIWPFGRDVGFAEAPIIGPANKTEGMAAGRMDWPHGFHVRRIRVAANTETPAFRRDEAEVVLMQSGSLELVADGVAIELLAGDVMTVPIGTPRAYRNSSAHSATAYVVRGGDHPGGYLRDRPSPSTKLEPEPARNRQ